MVLTSGALETSERALETRKPSSCLEKLSPFCISVVHGPLRAVVLMAALEPSPREGRLQAMRHVAVSEPSLVERQCPELRDTWQHQSLP
jgi:hypothetical protein